MARISPTVGKGRQEGRRVQDGMFQSLLHSCFDGHAYCVLVFTIVDCAGINSGLEVTFSWDIAIPRDRIAGSFGRCIFKCYFLINKC